jgi:IS30 family transposase
MCASLGALIATPFVINFLEYTRNGVALHFRIFPDEKATQRKKVAHKHKRFNEDMKKIIEEKIKENWSPEQINGYCKKHKINMVSHERIYLYVREDKVKGSELRKYLRHAKKRRKKYGTEERRGQIKDKRSIDERPKIVDQKIRFGDWEADTIIGHNHKGCILTLVERKTKITLIENVKNKKAATIKEAIVKQLTPLKNFCHTITFDNGKEFAMHKEVEKALEIKTYFAHPYSSYERGLNENTNGLIRQYIPKKTDFRNMPDFIFGNIIRKLNTRPRKTLGFASPIEAFLQMRL